MGGLLGTPKGRLAPLRNYCGGGGPGPTSSYAYEVVSFNPIVLRNVKIVCNFGLSECNSVKKRQKSFEVTHTL